MQFAKISLGQHRVGLDWVKLEAGRPMRRLQESSHVADVG